MNEEKASQFKNPVDFWRTMMKSVISQDDVSKMILKILEELDAELKKEETVFNNYDRLTWLCKEAYIEGATEAIRMELSHPGTLLNMGFLEQE